MSDTQTLALRRGAGAFVAARDVIAVRGADAASYLQGQLSQDIEPLAIGESAESLLLQPDGKLNALLRVTKADAQSFIIDVDAGCGDAVMARLQRFLLRLKVEMESLPWRCVSLRGNGVEQAAAGLLAALSEAGVMALPFAWNGWSGVDLLGPRDLVLDPGAGGLPDNVVACDRDVVEACRIVSGIPAMGAELTDKTIAAEAGLVERTVSFTKGCYTGQELVARLDARGNKVARRLVGLLAAGSPDTPGPPLAVGMTLHAPTDGGRGDVDATSDKVIGTVTSAAWSSELDAWAALGYVHRSIEVPGAVRVRSGDGIGDSWEAQARLLPMEVPSASA